jgi:phage protein D
MILPVLEQRRPAGCVVETGTPLTDLATRRFYPALAEVTVERSRGKAGEGTLVLDSRRATDGTWEVQDSGVFDEWTPIRVAAAFGVGVPVEVMRGHVREVKVEHPENPGESRVTVTFQDLSSRADRVHHREAWGADAPISDKVLVPALLQRNQLVPDLANADGLSGIEVNQDGTDAALLRKRAEVNGYDLVVEGETVYFGPPRLAAPTQPAIRVAAGPATNCLAFEVEVDGRRPDEVVVEFAREDREEPDRIRRGPDLEPLGRARVTSTSLGDHTLVLRGEAGADREAHDRRARAKANELSFKVRAQGELDGTSYGAVLTIGRTVRVDGVGDRYSGTYLVDTVRHVFDTDGYRQRFTLLRNAVGDAGPADTARPGDLLSVLR